MKGLAFLIASPVLLISALLPLFLIRLLGAQLGGLLAYFNTRAAQVTAINLKLCFPSDTEAQRAQTKRSSLIHLGQTYMEIGLAWLRPSKMNALLCREVEGGDRLEKALNAEKSGGTLLIMPHIGNWEIMPGYFLGRFGKTLHVLHASPYRDSKIMGWMMRLLRRRRQLVQHAVNTTGIRNVVHALSAGGTLLMLPDQEPHQGAAFVKAPFFALPNVGTATLALRLAKHAQERVFFAYVLRTRKGFKVCFKPMTDLHKLEKQDGVSKVNRAIEHAIEHDRGQYLWSYKRFKQILYHQLNQRYP